ncbi:uncharacterized protein LOC112327304 isoform X2 [Populus trichocarpa]|uniref:uncharacterized protein LOC112327304 isoform X2 n=1 Tax=Populus trichocarpa TaxID=3694 RepID=UPI00227837C6|nr:uncharacterized protein LOC112327304 isoform X2 [Populus trichocarpa]
MEFIIEEGKCLNKETSTLILPALSIGNVGQLAVDLLVSSTRAERIGYLDDPYILPCVGNDAYGPTPCGELALPLEAYDSRNNGVALVQQRSPVVKIFYLSSTNTDGTDDCCERLGWKKWQEYNPDQRSWKYLSSLAEGNARQEDNLPFEDEPEDEDYYPSLPFAALFSCFKAKGIKVTCLLCYCSEGDNTPEAFSLAEATSKLLGLSIDNSHGEGGKWLIPFSWRTVYGPPPDLSMF